MVHIPSLDVIAYCSGSAPLFKVFDPVTYLHTSPTVSGSFPAGFAQNGQQGMDWSEDLGCLLLWNNSGDQTVISTLTPGANPRTDAWTVGTLTVDGANAVTPSARSATGTYGRFGYSPFLKGCFVVNDVSQPIYFFATE